MNLPSSYLAIRSDLLSGKITCVQLVKNYLEVIHSHNQDFNIFLETFDDSALLDAGKVDQLIAQGKAGKLAGMVIGIKDLFCFSGHEMTCSSRILEGFESQITATAIQRMVDEGAIVIGRQNCDEFAMGSSNENSAFGPTKNPHLTSRVPGGSSGGSAAAVAASMCMVSLASDTGGSVRQPASFCGTVGLKPTYSRISRYGLTAYSSSFDTVGVLSNTVEDAALVLQVIAGQDDLDSTSSSLPVPEYQLEKGSSQKYKIALLSVFDQGVGWEEPVYEKFRETCDALKKEGHEIMEFDFPYLDYLLPTYYILTSAEASSNLSRYDGVRYGYRFQETDDLEPMYKKSRSQGFGKEVLRRILLGTFVLSASYHDAFYTKAQKARRLIKDCTEKILDQCDFIFLPTTPTTAFSLGSRTLDPIQMYLSDLFTVQASVSGIPAVSLPMGKDPQGLPIGLQVMGPAFGEEKLLKFSKELQEL